LRQGSAVVTSSQPHSLKGIAAAVLQNCLRGLAGSRQPASGCPSQLRGLFILATSIYIAAANIVANDTVTQPYHRGSFLDGHHVLNRDRQFVHFGLYQEYFSEGRTILGAACLYFPA
jgi:hypothetical protein